MISSLDDLLRSMKPVLHEGEFVFCAAEKAPADAIATFREEEGLTVVIDRGRADELSLPYSHVAAWITLTVHSDLNAVGFLAAVTRALADAGISCNVIAALFHDHLFVPWEKRHEAMRVLVEQHRNGGNGDSHAGDQLLHQQRQLSLLGG